MSGSTASFAMAAVIGGGYDLNTGGPASRTRTERVVSSLLGQDGPIRCPLLDRLGLDFGDKDPREVMHRLLKSAEVPDPEGLRHRFHPPPAPRMCRAAPEIQRLVVATAEPDRVLYQALLLGLCSAVLYDPSRPVMWTNGSLTRAVELYDLSGFYA